MSELRNTDTWYAGRRLLRAILAVALMVGMAWVLFSKAQIPSVSFEAEAGDLTTDVRLGADVQASGAAYAGLSRRADGPVKLIFDTDMGNDVDDALALSMIHGYVTSGQAELLAVTLTKDNIWAAPFVDLVNTFYGRGDIPIGAVRNGVTREDSRFIRETAEARLPDGTYKYPHDVLSGADVPDATTLLRRQLAAQPDGSVVLVVVGFSTNISRLLDSPADDISPLTGMELIGKKVRLLSSMAGSFDGSGHKEYNIERDIPSAQDVYDKWPTPVHVSGFEIGMSLPYPERSLHEKITYTANHPVKDAFAIYNGTQDRPSWDLTSVLQAVEPDEEYFHLSDPGKVIVAADSRTTFQVSPTGLHRYLVMPSGGHGRIIDRLVELATMAP